VNEIKRVAVITGASRGIGRACALALAQPQTKIYLNDVANWDEAEHTRQAVQAQGAEAEIIKFDVSNLAEVSAGFEQIAKNSGRLDILVNNAGIVQDNLVVRMKEEQWDRVLSVNLKGAFNCTRAAARPMLKQHFGRIINIASIVGVMGNPGQANYVASKAGLIGFTLKKTHIL